jgi:hypothetical protein
MAGITLNLSPETEQKLRAKAALAGQSLAAYLEQLAEQDAHGKNGPGGFAATLSDEEMERLLNDLSGGPTLAHLPTDFSRADIYADHD